MNEILFETKVPADKKCFLEQKVATPEQRANDNAGITVITFFFHFYVTAKKYYKKRVSGTVKYKYT